MKFLGVEITFSRPGSKEKSKAAPEQPETISVSSSKAVATAVNYGYTERKTKEFTLKTYRKKSPAADIVFPEPENPDDPWQQQALANLVHKTHKMFEQGWFDVCIPRDGAEQFKVPRNGAASMAYEKLRILHCVRYEAMNPALYAQIPALMTCMFTGGDIAPENIWD